MLKGKQEKDVTSLPNQKKERWGKNQESKTLKMTFIFPE